MDSADADGGGPSRAVARPVLLEQPPPGFLPTRHHRAWLVELEPGWATVIHEEPLHPEEKLALEVVRPDGTRVQVTAHVHAEAALTRRVRQSRLALLEPAAHTRLASSEDGDGVPSSKVRGLALATSPTSAGSTWFWVHDTGGEDLWLFGEDWLPVGARTTLRLVRAHGLSEGFEAVVLDAEPGHPFGCRLRVHVTPSSHSPLSALRGFGLPDLRAFG